jgi:Kdo2-lipid IVA lauroyltransferase/acyltransferase
LSNDDRQAVASASVEARGGHSAHDSATGASRPPRDTTATEARKPALAAEAPRSLLRFWSPRYWPAWCLVLWMRLSAALPLRSTLLIHRLIGRMIHRVSPKLLRVVLRNLEICFPELTPEQRADLARRHFESLAMSFPECAVAWFTRRVERRFEIMGLEHLHAAVQKGKGVVLYTGHFTTLEICGQALKALVPRLDCMFSHRSNPLLDEIQRRGRARNSHNMFSSDNVRSMLKALKGNATVWYAPDLMYKEGELIPFFGELAMTNVSTSKLARVSGAAVIPYSYRRYDREARYEIRFHAPLADFPTDDAVADTRRLVELLEQFIHESPDQYQWMHKRFKARPAELPDLYKRAEEP